MGKKEGWKSTRDEMANVYAYIENIKNFDITTIKEKQIKKITNSDIKNYTVDEAKAKSLAAA